MVSGNGNSPLTYGFEFRAVWNISHEIPGKAWNLSAPQPGQLVTRWSTFTWIAMENQHFSWVNLLYEPFFIGKFTVWVTFCFGNSPFWLGKVTNYKWSFSIAHSKVRIFGWVSPGFCWLSPCFCGFKRSNHVKPPSTLSSRTPGRRHIYRQSAAWRWKTGDRWKITMSCFIFSLDTKHPNIPSHWDTSWDL